MTKGSWRWFSSRRPAPNVAGRGRTSASVHPTAGGTSTRLRPPSFIPRTAGGTALGSAFGSPRTNLYVAPTSSWPSLPYLGFTGSRLHRFRGSGFRVQGLGFWSLGFRI
jgi:hypothetical protein